MNNQNKYARLCLISLCMISLHLQISTAYAACATGNCGSSSSTGTNNPYIHHRPGPTYTGKRFETPYPVQQDFERRTNVPYVQQYPHPYYQSNRPCTYDPCGPIEGSGTCTTTAKRWFTNAWTDVQRDFLTYFQSCNLAALTGVLFVAGVSANTTFDASIRRHWQDNIRTSRTNAFFNPFNKIGGFSYYVPLYAALIGIGAWQQCTRPGNLIYTWSYRSLRTMLLTTVQQIPLAVLTGSGRPIRNEPSKWQPFKYTKGVSGHAVVGAIPFLTAAMMTDPPLLKYTLYAASTLPGLARINFDAHYFSQVLLGWSIAFLSSRAVYHSDQLQDAGLEVVAVPREDGGMLMAKYKF